MIDRLFLHHPRDVGESYARHARAAGGFGLVLLAAGLAALVHAAVPALFARTASDTVKRLHARLGARQVPPSVGTAEWQPTYEI